MRILIKLLSHLFSDSCKQNQDNGSGDADDFYKLPSDHQLAVLKRKLHYFQAHMSSGDYMRFMQGFRMCLQSTAQNLQIRRGSGEDRLHLESISRRLLYSKIIELEAKVEEKRRHKLVLLRKENDRRFKQIVMEILNDENFAEKLEATGPCDELGMILNDLDQIDKEKGKVQDWSERDKKEINAIAEKLMTAPKSSTLTLVIDHKNVVIPNIEDENLATSLLQDVCSHNVLPVLTVKDIEAYFNAGKYEGEPLALGMDATQQLCTDLHRNRTKELADGAHGERDEAKVRSKASGHHNVNSSDHTQSSVDTSQKPDPDFLSSDTTDINGNLLDLPMNKPPAAGQHWSKSLHSTLHDYAMDAIYREQHGLEQCCALDSASCMLTSALVAEKVSKQENISKEIERRKETERMVEERSDRRIEGPGGVQSVVKFKHVNTVRPEQSSSKTKISVGESKSATGLF